MLALLLQDIPAQPTALPQRIVGVLHRQGRQRILGTLAEGLVKQTQLTGQHTGGPAVGDDVVHGHQQHMVILGHANQASAHQRSTCQVETLVGLFGGNRQQLSFRVGLPVQHLRLQAETDIGRGNALFNVLALLLDKGGTQHLVAGDDTIQRLLEGRVIQAATQTQAGRDVIRRATAV